MSASLTYKVHMDKFPSSDAAPQVSSLTVSLGRTTKAALSSSQQSSPQNMSDNVCLKKLNSLYRRA